MPELEPIANIILHQREHWDGSGRPDGLHGEAIPIESRILDLVVHFQELTQVRGDRPALSLSESLEKCQKHSGARFQPLLVGTLETIIRLVEMDFMQLPQQPKRLPMIWLEDSSGSR